MRCGSPEFVSDTQISGHFRHAMLRKTDTLAPVVHMALENIHTY